MTNKITNPPGPRIFFPLALITRFRSDPLGFIQQMTEKYGDTVSFQVLGRSYYLFNNPASIQQVLVARQRSFQKGQGFQLLKNLIGDGLVTSEGELHLNQRRMMQPMFHR